MSAADFHLFSATSSTTAAAAAAVERRKRQRPREHVREGRTHLHPGENEPRPPAQLREGSRAMTRWMMRQQRWARLS